MTTSVPASRPIVSALVLLVVAAPRVALCEPDPLALQAQAVRRIDAFVDHFRRTGDLRALAPELERAGAELAESNRLLEARGTAEALALGLLSLGHVHRMRADWSGAVRWYEEAERAAARAGNVSRRAAALAYRALAESSALASGSALEHATRAVELARQGGDAEVLFKALDIRSEIQAAQGDLAAASAGAEAALQVAVRLPDRVHRYYALVDRADVYVKSGDRCDRERAFAECFRAHDRARADFEEAAAVAQELGFDHLARFARERLPYLAAQRRKFESQARLDAVLNEGGPANVFRPKEPGDVLVTETFVLPPYDGTPELARERDQVARLHAWTKQHQRDLGAFAEVAAARGHFVDGRMAEMNGDADAALGEFVAAVDAVERDRRALRDDRTRSAYVEDRIVYYHAALQQLLERRRHADAFDMLERSRSRALADLLASRDLSIRDPAERALYGKSVELRTRIGGLQDQLFALAASPDRAARTPEAAALDRQLRALEAERRRVMERIARSSPRLQGLVEAKRATLPELQRSMRAEGYEILQYVVQEHGIVVWHAGPDSTTVRNVFLPKGPLLAKVAALRRSLAARGECAAAGAQGRGVVLPGGERDACAATFDDATARELFLFLVQPVRDRIRSERLVVIPHDVLNQLPFQALRDPEGRFMGERFQLSYAPSATVLLGLRRAAAVRAGRLLAVAEPGLAWARGEVDAVARLFPERATVVTDRLAGKAEVEAWAPGRDVVHLAVHGTFDAEEPMRSFVQLAPGGETGRLTAAEMFGLRLDRGPLVVLSGCETGRSEATAGNEMVGIVRALVYAGAGAVVLSQWKVDDAATSLWMQAFYAEVRTSPPAAAARAAIRRVMREPAYQHPYYWAAFGVVGR